MSRLGGYYLPLDEQAKQAMLALSYGYLCRPKEEVSLAKHIPPQRTACGFLGLQSSSGLWQMPRALVLKTEEKHSAWPGEQAYSAFGHGQLHCAQESQQIWSEKGLGLLNTFRRIWPCWLPGRCVSARQSLLYCKHDVLVCMLQWCAWRVRKGTLRTVSQLAHCEDCYSRRKRYKFGSWSRKHFDRQAFAPVTPVANSHGHRGYSMPCLFLEEQNQSVSVPPGKYSYQPSLGFYSRGYSSYYYKIIQS